MVRVKNNYYFHQLPFLSIISVLRCAVFYHIFFSKLIASISYFILLLHYCFFSADEISMKLQEELRKVVSSSEDREKHCTPQLNVRAIVSAKCTSAFISFGCAY